MTSHTGLAAETTESASAHSHALIRRGYLMVLASVFCNGARFHLEKAGLNAGAAPIVSITLGSFSAVAGLLLLGVLARLLGVKIGGFEGIYPRSVALAMRSQWRAVLMAMSVGTIGGWFFSVSNDWYGPEATSFVGNLTLCFLVLTGMFKGEKLRLIEIASIGIIVGGAFLFSYREGQIVWGLIGLVALAAALTACKHWFMKIATASYHMPSVMAASYVVMGSFAAVIATVGGQWQFGSAMAVTLLAVGGVIGSAIGMSLLYSGYHHAGVARGAALDSGRPLATLLIGLALGAALPAWWQLIGGALVLAGSVALARSSKKAPPHEGMTGATPPENDGPADDAHAVAITESKP